MSVATEWDVEYKESSGGDGAYEACPKGNHPGTVIGVLNIGNQPCYDQKKNEHYERKEYVFLIELVEEKSDGTPFVFGYKCAAFLSDTSNLTALASSVLGDEFKANDKLDPRTLIGKPCMVDIEHNEGKNKKGESVIYANIASKGIKGWNKKMQPPKPTKDWLVYSVESNDPIPNDSWLPWIYGKSISVLVKQSAEYRQRNQSFNGDLQG